MAENIHRYERRMERLRNVIQASEIGSEEKELLAAFDTANLVVQGLSLPRRIKLLENAYALRKRLFCKPFREVTIDDIKECIRRLEEVGYSPWTVSSFKVVIKKVFKWIEQGDRIQQVREYPALVSWIRIHVKKKDQPKIRAADILTPEEAERIVRLAGSSRDRAFLAMLYELGARISEIGNLKIRDLTRDQYSYVIDLHGKTGHRTPRIVISDPHLTEWLNHHPLKDDPNAPLWVCANSQGVNQKMLYGALRAVVLRIKEKADIKKRLYPHLFRHSRATHLLVRRELNEAQVKTYFGWAPDSKMLSEYSHLMSKDVNDTLLRIHGIVVDEPQAHAARTCPRCSRVNLPEAKFCVHCSSILDAQAAASLDQASNRQDRLLNLVLQDKTVQKLLLEKLLAMDPKALQELAH